MFSRLLDAKLFQATVFPGLSEDARKTAPRTLMEVSVCVWEGGGEELGVDERQSSEFLLRRSRNCCFPREERSDEFISNAVF